MHWITQHKLLFGVLIVAIVGCVWYGLSRNSAPPPLLTSDISPESQVLGENTDQELVGTLLELRAVTLSGSILGEPAFTSLHDFGTTIVAEPVGRTNPFAPFGGGTAAASTSRSTQTTPARR